MTDTILTRLRLLGAREYAREMGAAADSNRDLARGTLEAREAALKQERATQQVEQAVRRFGHGSLEARDAQGKLERANEDVARSMGRQEESASGAGIDIEGLGKKAGIAALAVAGLDAAIGAAQKALDRDFQSDMTAGALGLSERDSRKAGLTAAQAYADGYGESIEQVNEAIVSVGQNVARVNELRPDVLARLTRRSLNIAAVFGPEVNEVTRVVGDQLRNGMARNSEDVFDLLAVGFQRGANRADELLDTLREYAEPVKSLGLGTRDFMNILVAGADAGVYSSDRLGDALKELSIRAVDGSETTSTAYRALGLDVDATATAFAAGGPQARRALSTVISTLGRVGDRVRREQIGVNLFGAIWEDVGWRAIRSLDPAKDALGRFGGAARRLDRTIGDGPKQTMDRFFRDLENDSVNVIGGVVIPLIEGDFSTALRNLGTSFRDEIDGISLGFEAIANSAILVVNQAIGAYNELPNFLQRPTGGEQVDPISYVGAYGERLLNDAAARMPQLPVGDELLDQIRRTPRRGGSANPLWAAPVPDVVNNRPMARGSASTSRARTLNLNVGVNVNGREIGRASEQAVDGEEQWR